MKYEYWFASLRGIPAKEKLRIREKVASAKEIFDMDDEELEKIGVFEKFRKMIFRQDSTKEFETYERMKEKKMSFVTLMDPTYPSRLRKIPSPPYAIYYKGALPDEKKKTAAIVGARSCSAYGKKMAEEFAKELAKNGVQIISGMALGVDGAGQRGAIEAGGTSFAVLGCGVDICYPRENFSLYQSLEEKGGILSEFPVGTEPLKQNFPARNRIISGLSDVVLVMEAKEKSGSLITADMALEQGKDVYALPGPITSCLSKGCHDLIRQGAGILISPKELLEDLGICSKGVSEKVLENKIVLESAENLVYSCLNFQPMSPNQISAAAKLPIQSVLEALIRLELMGYVLEVSKNYYVKIK